MLRAFPPLVILLLLSSTLALTRFGGFALGNMMFPEQPPRGVTITSGGTVEGTDQIQVSGNTFTLTGNIGETIVILREGVILDGAGYTLGGTGSGTGIFIQGRDHTTIKNLKITNFNYGIKFTWLNYDSNRNRRSATISGNTITGNKYGIAFIQETPQCEISNNQFSDNTYAVYSPHEAVFRGNQFKNNAYSISDDYHLNDVDASNTVNGKPIYYWVNQQDKAVPSDAGWVALKGCKNITVQGLNLDRCGDGLILFNTSVSTIKGNVLTSNAYGIRLLQQSNNNIITDNTIGRSSDNGIYMSASSNNTISKNQITANSKDGIAIDYYSYNNTINQNQITTNTEAGVMVKGTMQNVYTTFPSLNLTNPPFQHANLIDNTVVSQNNISKNGMGMWINSRESLTIVLNNITDNIGWGMKLEGSQKDNIIHHNNFINNNAANAITQLQVCIAGLFKSTFNPNPNSTYIQPDIAFVAGDANIWNNGREGNYWSDYAIRYPNATQAGTSGVGDTPFYINENNIDHYPLMSPVDIFNVDSTLPTQPSAQDSEAQQNAFLNPTIIIASIASAAVASAGLVLFIKRRSKRSVSAN